MSTDVGITVIEDQFRTALATVITDWLIRWPNENWPVNTALSPDNAPLDAFGNPAPFVEAEVIAGLDQSSVAPPGMRQSTRIGLFRVYFIVPQGSGRADVNNRVDDLALALKRATLFIDETTGRRLTTMDPRIDDNVAERLVQSYVRTDAAVPAPWHGARYVRMLSVPWFWDYYA